MEIVGQLSILGLFLRVSENQPYKKGRLLIWYYGSIGLFTTFVDLKFHTNLERPVVIGEHCLHDIKAFT